MKRYDIVFSEAAKHDLGNIFLFVEEISSEENAKLVIFRIAKRVSKLEYFPSRTEPFAKNADGNLIRALVCGRYRALYTVNGKKQEIVIVRVISVAQNTTDYID